MAIIIGTSGGDTLAGSNAGDELYGLDGDDLLEGEDGDDLLDGGAGADQMAGGAGDDVYLVDDVGDAIVEIDGEGDDEIRTGLADYILPDHVERLTGLSLDYQGLTGNGLDNVIAGSEGYNSISGEGGDDTILASGGGDWVGGGDGHDTYVLAGGVADYEIVYDEWGLRVIDLVGSEPDTYLSAIEAFRFEADDVTITVDAMFNRYGTAGEDDLVGNESDNLLFGYESDDRLTGLGGRDILDGGAGADTMIGGAGMDDYHVDDAGDLVVEDAGGGDDRVFVSLANYTMTANVEVLWTLLDVDSTLIGSSTDNWINGGAGNDSLEGRGGHDQLDGGAGADTLTGGTGNDDYTVDDAGDVVVEASGGGIDSVQTGLASYTLPAHVENLFGWGGDQVLTGNGLANRITVGHGIVVADGGAGNDTLSYWNEWEAVLVDLQTGAVGGAAADDILTGFENLAGSAGDDELRGTAAANSLDGSWGADTLVGRGGNDVYQVDNDGDSVVEEAGEGSDEVRTILAAYTLPDHVEKLRFTGEDGFTGTGNALNNDLTGGAAEDWLYGGDGQDSLSGGAGDDHLDGGAGHDTLSGGGGADTMAGGDGHDVYVVDHEDDAVLELAGEGVDQVFASSAAFTLPDEVENLNYNAYGAFHGIGNALANVLYGGSAADTLEGLSGDDELRGGGGADSLAGGAGDDLIVGGAGADLLEGGADADTFRIGAYESGTGASADRIADFASGEDLIDLSSIDADTGTAGDQAFTFIGAAAFSSTAGELRYAFDGIDTWLQADTNGDALPDFEIVLSGPALLSPPDFIL